jgi:hypothetical protein
VFRLLATLLLGAAACTGLSAQEAQGDPLSSSECRAARTELDSALAEPAANPQARSQRLARARQQAALLCLGREASGRERHGAPEPVQSVPPAVISARPAPALPAAIAPPQPPLAIPRAATITACDPAGCWDSDGRRLNNMGPLLMGPRGLCTLQGGLLNCP